MIAYLFQIRRLIWLSSQRLVDTVELSGAQIKSAQILLDKALPNLTMADITQHTQAPVSHAEVYQQLVDVVGDEIAEKILGKPEQHQT